MKERQAAIARRLALLELEAEVQRATLSATFTQWEQKKALAYATSLGNVAMGLMRVPRIRWLIIGTLLTKFRKKKHKEGKDGE